MGQVNLNLGVGHFFPLARKHTAQYQDTERGYYIAARSGLAPASAILCWRKTINHLLSG